MRISLRSHSMLTIARSTTATGIHRTFLGIGGFALLGV